jgi:hypothetical protein
MTTLDATFSGLKAAVEVKAMPTPTPSAKIAPKMAIDV